MQTEHWRYGQQSWHLPCLHLIMFLLLLSYYVCIILFLVPYFVYLSHVRLCTFVTYITKRYVMLCYVWWEIPRQNLARHLTTVGEQHAVGLRVRLSYSIVQANSFIFRWRYGCFVSVASALVSSRLDQVNSILYGAASKHINRRQRVQNALARVVT